VPDCRVVIRVLGGESAPQRRIVACGVAGRRVTVAGIVTAFVSPDKRPSRTILGERLHVLGSSASLSITERRRSVDVDVAERRAAFGAETAGRPDRSFGS